MSGPATGRAISSTEDGPRYEPECIPDHLDFPDEEIALPVAGPDIHRVTKGAITARLQATDQENPPTPAAPNTGVCAKAAVHADLATAVDITALAPPATTVGVGEKAVMDDYEAMDLEGPHVPLPANATYADQQVCRESVMATESIDWTKRVQPTCAMGGAPLDEMIHVPARASAAINVGDGHPSSAVNVVALLDRGWPWGIVGVFTYVGVQMAGLLISATFPLRVGEEALPRVDNMPYWRRLLAVLILRLRANRSGGGTVYIILQMALAVKTWQLWGTPLAFVLAGLTLTSTYAATRPRHSRTRVEDCFDAAMFQLLHEYFDFKIVREDETAMEEYEHSPSSCMIAQFPLSIVEIMYDVLGVRRTRAAEKRVDGREGAAVVKGGPEEHVVTELQDTSAGLTLQFVRDACAAQEIVIPMYVFGASRASLLLPGCDNRLTRAVSKFPGLMFGGAFGLVPYRQQLTIVIGRPITVTNATFRDVATDNTCRAIQEAMRGLATKYRPEWERPDAI